MDIVAAQSKISPELMSKFISRIGDGTATACVEMEDMNHNTNELGNNNSPLPNLDLYVYDSNGNLIASSTTLYSNFEIVLFIPTSPGIYTVKITGTTEAREYVGLAMW